MAGDEAKPHLPPKIDLLIYRYLYLVDEYISLMSRLSAIQSSMYLRLAEANFAAPHGERFGPEKFPAVMKARRTVEVTPLTVVATGGKHLREDDNTAKKHGGLSSADNEGHKVLPYGPAEASSAAVIASQGTAASSEDDLAGEKPEKHECADHDYGDGDGDGPDIPALASNLKLREEISRFRIVDVQHQFAGRMEKLSISDEKKADDKGGKQNTENQCASTSKATPPSQGLSGSPLASSPSPPRPQEKKDEKSPTTLTNDPLFWFSAFPGRALRAAKADALIAATEIVPRMASVVAEMRAVEAEVRRLRKWRAKEKAAVGREEGEERKSERGG